MLKTVVFLAALIVPQSVAAEEKAWVCNFEVNMPGTNYRPYRTKYLFSFWGSTGINLSPLDSPNSVSFEKTIDTATMAVGVKNTSYGDKTITLNKVKRFAEYVSKRPDGSVWRIEKGLCLQQ